MNAPALALATIQVEVSFYDDDEMDKLKAYPTFPAIQKLVEQPPNIPKAEFLTYYLFHRIKLGMPGYRDYESVAGKVHLWLLAIRECIDYEYGTVSTPEGARQQLNEVTEHVGEAIGLAVMNRIHGLTEADWAPIPEQRGRGAKPSFDFQIASDGTQFVQVETKGSSVADNRELTDAVKAQKRKIDEKKAKLAVHAKNGDDPNPASFRYGTIAVVDGRKDGLVRCLLTDPPPDEIDEIPERFRLLTRMRFLRNVISFLSPRSPFASALATRVAALEALKDPFELDSVPLMRGTSDKYEFVPYGFENWRHSTFMTTKSRVTDGPTGGVVMQLSSRALFFLGIREDLLELAANQEFKKISSYKAPVASIEKTVECTFSIGRYSSLELPNSIVESAKKTSGYVYFRLTGTLHYSAEGLVFGILTLPKE